jgi:hypothetical protein
MEEQESVRLNQSSHNTIETLVMKLIDTVNNLKADIGGRRRLIANPDATKRNRKDNFQKGQMKKNRKFCSSSKEVFETCSSYKQSCDNSRIRR